MRNDPRPKSLSPGTPGPAPVKWADAGEAPSRLQRSLLWRIKLRLQFTGWLQYLAPLAPALLLLILAGAGAGALIGVAPLLFVWLPLTLGLLLLLMVAFDLITIRLNVRPREPHPPRLEDRDVFDVMRARRSCRSFQRQDLTGEDRAALLSWAADATRPEALLGSAPIRLEYITAPLTVWPVVGAHEFLVAIAPRQYDRVAVIDVGRSLQKVAIEATRAGISTCWIGPGADQSSVVAALGARFDPEHEHVICVCAVGYRSRFVPLLIRAMNAKMHSRLPLQQLYFADDKLTRPVDVTTPPYSELGRSYEVCQWSPSSYNGQTTRAVLRAGDAVERVDFECTTSSRYYAPVALGIWLANWETGCRALGVHGHSTVLPERHPPPGATPDQPRSGATWLRDNATPTRRAISVNTDSEVVQVEEASQGGPRGQRGVHLPEVGRAAQASAPSPQVVRHACSTSAAVPGRAAPTAQVPTDPAVPGGGLPSLLGPGPPRFVTPATARFSRMSTSHWQDERRQHRGFTVPSGRTPLSRTREVR